MLSRHPFRFSSLNIHDLKPRPAALLSHAEPLTCLTNASDCQQEKSNGHSGRYVTKIYIAVFAIEGVFR